MFKKILGIALALVLVLSMGIICASAAETDVAETGAAETISFDANSAGWKNFSQVYCHVWAWDGKDTWPVWQSKAERCTDNGDGTWSYDLSKTGNAIQSGRTYCVIFSADTGVQTYDLCFNTSCIGDTAYCDGTTYENPADSNKTAQAAFWKSGACGPVFQVTSIGNIAGTYVPEETTPEEIFDKFCNEKDEATGMTKLQNAVLYDKNGRTEEQIKKDVAAALNIDLNANSSQSSNNNSSSASNNTSTGTTKTTTNKPASASGNATTGQGTTVVFIMLGIMLASAGIIFFTVYSARKAK